MSIKACMTCALWFDLRTERLTISQPGYNYCDYCSDLTGRPKYKPDVSDSNIDENHILYGFQPRAQWEKCS